MTKNLSIAVAALVLASASPAFADSGNKCAESASWGSSCISITGEGLRVDDVQGYYVPPHNDYLSHRRWALRLTSYHCNPIERSHCGPRHQWFTRIRHTNPPQEGSECDVFTPNGIGWQQCRNFGMAEADAKFGDWHGFFPMSHRFHHETWLCSELAVRKHHHWTINGPGHSAGVRGCAQVHA